MYANRKYYAYHAAQLAQEAAEEAAATPQERKAKAQLMAKARRIFDQFDEDGSGFVSTSEVSRMVKMLKLGLTRSQVKEMVAAADLDMSGQMKFEEFRQRQQLGCEAASLLAATDTLHKSLRTTRHR
jgi:Flp pilus assembly protein TadG